VPERWWWVGVGARQWGIVLCKQDVCSECDHVWIKTSWCSSAHTHINTPEACEVQEPQLIRLCMRDTHTHAHTPEACEVQEPQLICLCIRAGQRQHKGGGCVHTTSKQANHAPWQERDSVTKARAGAGGPYSYGCPPECSWCSSVWTVVQV
jgi:hypothetical protein